MGRSGPQIAGPDAGNAHTDPSPCIIASRWPIDLHPGETPLRVVRIRHVGGRSVLQPHEPNRIRRARTRYQTQDRQQRGAT